MLFIYEIDCLINFAQQNFFKKLTIPRRPSKQGSFGKSWGAKAEKDKASNLKENL